MWATLCQRKSKPLRLPGTMSEVISCDFMSWEGDLFARPETSTTPPVPDLYTPLPLVYPLRLKEFFVLTRLTVLG